MSEKANAEGKALVDWIAAKLLRNGTPLSLQVRELTPEEAEAEARLLSFAGIWHSGNPHSSDNEQVDADLYS